MSRENVELVSRVYDAWNRRDPHCEAFWASDAEACDRQRAPDAAPVVRGIKEIKHGWLRWMLLLGDISAELEDHVEIDDWVICLTHWHGSADNAPVDLHSVEAFQVREGRIRRAVVGYDSKEQALNAVSGFSSGAADRDQAGVQAPLPV